MGACAKKAPSSDCPEIPSAAPPQAQEQRAGSVPFLENLDSYQRPITTSSPLAQRYFNQGLALLQGFNHFAAAQSFQAAADADPDCLMAYVGLALANGPHINRWAMTSLQTKEAWRALQLGKKAKHASPLERELFAAVQKRYVQEERKERKDLNQAYADAMRDLWTRYPKDPDIGAFFAEAAMNLRPWDYWDKLGNPHPGTLKSSPPWKRSWSSIRIIRWRCTSIFTPSKARPPPKEPSPRRTDCDSWSWATVTCCTCPRISTLVAGIGKKPSRLI